MLPRLPHRLFQRPIHFSKCVLASRRSSFSPNAAVSVNAFERELKSISSSRTFSTQSCSSCKSVGSQSVWKGLNTNQKRIGCRYKTTKPKRNDAKEVNALDEVEDKPEEEHSLSSSSVQETSQEAELLRKRRTSGDMIVTKSEGEEEKSRRRYEKEDPPEEERHEYWRQRPERAIIKSLMKTEDFDNMKAKDKDNFALAIEIFRERDVHLKGHVEFIYVALKQMKKFGIHKDLESYKKIIDVFPKGRMIQTNMFQVEFMHYPKHQQCAIDVLEQMEDNGVIPDSEVQEMLTNIFGSWSFPMRKACRMLYWMPKFKNLSPWRLPDPLPDNTMELAKLAVQQMTSVDLQTKISIYDCSELEDAYDLTWIVSGQSPDQQELIQNLPTDRPIYVEGAFRIWLKSTCLNYFILRGDPRPPPKKEKEDPDDVGNLYSMDDAEFLDTALEKVPSVHEQEDGVILGVCCTGTSSRDSVISWIRFLEQTNPRLGKDISVLFTLKSPIGPTDDLEILSYHDLAEIKKLGKQRDPYITSDETIALDPGMPDLRQVGIWTESDTKFPNWPHNFHEPDSISMKNKLENEKTLQELERMTEEMPPEIHDFESKDKLLNESSSSTKQPKNKEN